MLLKRFTLICFYILVIEVLAFGVYYDNYNIVYISLITIVIYTILEILEILGKIRMSWWFKFLVFLFVFGAEILGEVFNFYSLIPTWDNVLHFIFGFLSSCFGFSMIKNFKNLYNSFKSLPIVYLIIVICFSVTLGVVWEFFEYRMDRTFKFDMQKDTLIDNISSISFNSDGNNALCLDDILYTEIVFDGGTLRIDNGYLDIGLVDTISDMKINMIGSFTFGIFGVLYIVFPSKFNWINHFIIKFQK